MTSQARPKWFGKYIVGICGWACLTLGINSYINGDLIGGFAGVLFGVWNIRNAMRWGK